MHQRRRNLSRRHLNLNDFTSTVSINIHATPRYKRPETPTSSNKTGRRMCEKRNQNMMERFKFQHQLNGIMSSCDEEKCENRTLRKKVNNFTYFCDKLHKNMEEKHKRFIAKN